MGTCDSTVVGTLTIPKSSIGGETAFISTVIGKKGGVGIHAPSVKMISGRACPIPSTTTTTTVSATTVTTTTMTTSISNSSVSSGSSGSGGYYMGPFLGVTGG